ncbi:glucose dehydrogenase [FAD, quinone] [Folsomia candida]|uniref:glucose dehydrogenase [FAD, quinone] n=1 Tax=Folsomia candida TaxID=158441 RepID=UPI001604AF6B|nr:glucose dehydrogenase [FAD, quinone] [Folsomia candida]
MRYDFIIVGAGSSGAVIANRLSESGQFNVLLLEAGGDPLITEDVPYLSGLILNNPMTDWVMPWPRGKSLGGTSNLNHMIYMRGNPKDFDNWATLTGDPQWKYDNVLPYFKKFENYDGHFPSDEYHGKNGPMQVNTQSFEPQMEDWIKSGEELGFKKTDPNARQTSGFFPCDFTLSNGKRWGVYDGFIKPALTRTNLKVYRYARINLDAQNQATGVTYLRHGRLVVVNATKEVILSAGAVGSPHLLMLSGIGPATHLKSVKIEPKVDLPGVGQNLQDHVSCLYGPFILNSTESFIMSRDLKFSSLIEYATLGIGPLSWTYVSGLGLTHSSLGDPDWPDLALTYIPLGIYPTIHKDVAAFFGLKESLVNDYVSDFHDKDANFILVYNGLPKSRGSITLRSSDPFDAPLIDPKYFSDPNDMKVMIDGFKFAVKLYETANTWKKYNASLVKKHFPGCETHPLQSDAYYECYIRHATATMWHPTSSCKMGNENDPMTVVDSNLRVRKVAGLRIADASIMPQITNTNTNAPCIMIAEKMSAIILKTWG